MTIVSEKVATRIKEEHIAPIPRWRFQSERALVAFLLMMFLVIGALAISLVLELGDKLELESIIGRPQGFRLALSGFPYFWLIVVILFSVLAIADFLRTRNGYRYRLRNVVLVFVGAMVLLGLLIYTLSVSQDVHAFLGKNISLYSSVVGDPRDFWSQPDQGLLSGVVLSSDKLCDCMKIIDWNRVIWNVDNSHASIKPGVHLRGGEGIKIIGTEIDNHDFAAEKIRPWDRGFMKVMNKMDKEADDMYRDMVGATR